jgi:hypothetical protein
VLGVDLVFVFLDCPRPYDIGRAGRFGRRRKFSDRICRLQAHLRVGGQRVLRKTKRAQYVKENNWGLWFDLSLQVDGGNLWVKNHGHKYDALPSQLDAPASVRVHKFISAYDEYQAEEYGEADAKDAYGFLSEHSHPNGACFLPYREISGSQVRFISPPESLPLPSANRYLIEWMVFIHELLGLAKEDAVRVQILGILTRAVEPT